MQSSSHIVHTTDGLRGPGEARILKGGPNRHARCDEIFDRGAHRRIDRLGFGDRRTDGPILGGVVVDFQLIALGLRVHDRGTGVVGDDNWVGTEESRLGREGAAGRQRCNLEGQVDQDRTG